MDTTTRPILDLLIALVDQNLLRAREVDGEPRFELLRTIQEYAAEQLVRSGELHDVQQRHALYYLDLVERGDAAGHGRLPDNTSWLVQVCTSVAEPGAFEREVRAGRSCRSLSVCHATLADTGLAAAAPGAARLLALATCRSMVPG